MGYVNTSRRLYVHVEGWNYFLPFLERSCKHLALLTVERCGNENHVLRQHGPFTNAIQLYAKRCISLRRQSACQVLLMVCPSSGKRNAIYAGTLGKVAVVPIAHLTVCTCVVYFL